MTVGTQPTYMYYTKPIVGIKTRTGLYMIFKKKTHVRLVLYEVIKWIAVSALWHLK